MANRFQNYFYFTEGLSAVRKPFLSVFSTLAQFSLTYGGEHLCFDARKLRVTLFQLTLLSCFKKFSLKFSRCSLSFLGFIFLVPNHVMTFEDRRFKISQVCDVFTFFYVDSLFGVWPNTCAIGDNRPIVVFFLR